MSIDGRPLRIAVFARGFPQISETFILDQVVGLIERGHAVDVFAEAEVAGAEHEAVRRLELRKRVRAPARTDRGAGATAVQWGRLARYVAGLAFRRNRYDVIHCHYGTSGLRADRLRRLRLIRGALAVTFHAHDLTRVPRTGGADVYRSLLGRADAILAVSEHGARRLRDLGAPADRLRVHHMGVDTAGIAFRPRSPSPDGPLRVLTVGRLVEKKGHAYALRALARVRDAGQPVAYEMIGDGPLRETIAAEAARLGLSDVVRLRGSLPRREVWEAMDRADLMLLPSVTAGDGDEEGIPVALMEAMAAGLPVVSTRHAGIPELVRHEGTGVLAPERDVAALAEAVTRVARRGITERMLVEARRHVVEAFDSRTQNDLLVARFRVLAGGAP